jgi:phosphatidylglycerophosphatase A
MIRDYKRFLTLVFVTGFGCGYAPAPGTCATLLVGVPLVWYIQWVRTCSVGTTFWIALASSLCALIGTHYALYFFPGRQEDPQEIVIDEIIGFLWACVGMPLSVYQLWIRFILFRFLDVSKCWPVGMFERLPGAWGVVGDDLVAGIITAALAHITCG